jgi:hypothetical protein
MSTANPGFHREHSKVVGDLLRRPFHGILLTLAWFYANNYLWEHPAIFHRPSMSLPHPIQSKSSDWRFRGSVLPAANFLLNEALRRQSRALFAV